MVVVVAIQFRSMDDPTSAHNPTVFLSSSIPDPDRWDQDFDALEITDAVVALCRACLTRGYRVVTAAHPTIAPLLLYVAAEFPQSASSRILIYQSLLFEDVLPTATRRFEADRVGEVIWTPAIEGEEPAPGRWDESLRTMREKMLSESQPVAAVFVGGMEGIFAEFEMVREIFPHIRTYSAGMPGGAASQLAENMPGPLGDELRRNRIYPSLWWAVLDDIEAVTA